jgi:hypothetical protein
MCLTTGIFYLMPGNAELFYCYVLNDGDYNKLDEVYFDMIKNRNYIYACGLAIFILSFTAFNVAKLVVYGVLLFCLNQYFTSIKKWQAVLE